jgi:hypothetical protein
MKIFRPWVPVRRLATSGNKLQREWLKYLFLKGLIENDWDIREQSCSISHNTNIGTMIEFLSDQEDCGLYIRSVCGDGWLVKHGEITKFDEELRYALWETILEVLNENKPT